MTRWELHFNFFVGYFSFPCVSLQRVSCNKRPICIAGKQHKVKLRQAEALKKNQVNAILFLCLTSLGSELIPITRQSREWAAAYRRWNWKTCDTVLLLSTVHHWEVHVDMHGLTFLRCDGQTECEQLRRSNEAKPAGSYNTRKGASGNRITDLIGVRIGFSFILIESPCGKFMFHYAYFIEALSG